MFDKFFTMKKGEKQKTLTAPYGEVMQITIGASSDDVIDVNKAAYAVEIIQNNVRETAHWISAPIDQVLKLEIKDGESLTVEAYYDDLDFHINGHIYKVT